MKFGLHNNRRLHLTSCIPVHSIPGRVRIESPAIAYLKTEGEEFVSRIQELEGVVSASINRLSSRALVSFDPAVLNLDELLESVEFILSSYSVAVYKEHKSEENMLPVSERRIQNEPIGELISRVGVMAVSIAFSFFSPQAPAAGLLKRLLSFNSITSISMSVPIIKNGLDSLIRARRPNADTLSASAIIASILAGKGFSALTIILLADLAELITAYSMERTRKAIREMLSIGDEYVWKLEGDDVVQTAREDLQEGDVILVHTGEKNFCRWRSAQGQGFGRSISHNR
jgi:cation-transporting P-type ATPase C